MTSVTRRQFGGILGLAGIAGTGLWIGGFPGVLSRNGNGAVVRSTAPLPEAYQLRFRTPPIASGSTGADGVLRYELQQRVADVEILPGLRTRALTYAGRSLPQPRARGHGHDGQRRDSLTRRRRPPARSPAGLPSRRSVERPDARSNPRRVARRCVESRSAVDAQPKQEERSGRNSDRCAPIG